MDYMTISEAATKWNLSNRRIQTLCSQGADTGRRACWLLLAPSKRRRKASGCQNKKRKVYRLLEKYKKPGKKNATDGLEGKS